RLAPPIVTVQDLAERRAGAPRQRLKRQRYRIRKRRLFRESDDLTGSLRLWMLRQKPLPNERLERVRVWTLEGSGVDGWTGHRVTLRSHSTTGAKKTNN